MSYYIECPDCGAHLDPGERCDCRSEEQEGAADAKPRKRRRGGAERLPGRKEGGAPVVDGAAGAGSYGTVTVKNQLERAAVIRQH